MSVRVSAVPLERAMLSDIEIERKVASEQSKLTNDFTQEQLKTIDMYCRNTPINSLKKRHRFF